MVRRENNEKPSYSIDKLEQADESRNHDLWFREQVTIGLIQANSPKAIWLTSEAVRARMKQRAKALAK
ncbi:hypothetical protein Q7A_714 [Methylophaga nitratireducenticrescens]|uniref:Uncharacterized protein n=1 Tax=Methylophaga nitratireducenticrescens TaxID=754476 RepID=I1XGP1_METNJ|nr:hypothetical protein Q7A_714 [Methylophaga nitratireducenticrescens]